MGAWPAENPDGSTTGAEQDLSFQTFATSSKMQDTILIFFYLVEDGTREQEELKNIYKKKNWGSSPNYNSQKHPKCLKKKKKKGTATRGGSVFVSTNSD